MSSSTAAPTQPVVNVVSLNSQHPDHLIGLPCDSPLLSWKLASLQNGLHQICAELEAASDPSFNQILATTSLQGDAQLEVKAPGGDLDSREVRWYRVRVETASGWSGYSESLRYEAGLVSGVELLGEAIGDDSVHSDPATLLRKEFTVSKNLAMARLFITGHGVYESTINGSEVAGEFLNPGWTPYDQRLTLATFDVSNLMREGVNAIGVTLGDGWYRGKLGFENEFDHFGTKTSLLMQLELTYADGNVERVVSDGSFKVSQGELRFGDIYDGSSIDYNFAQPGWDSPGFDESNWSGATIRKLDKSKIQPRIAGPIVKIHEFPMTLTEQSDRVLLDSGQNISGWVRLVVDGKKGQKITVRHSEVLEAGNNLHTAALRTAKAVDTYVLHRDGRHTLEPRFTFHGFQFADVVTEAAIVSGVGIAISSDTVRRATFSSSDVRLNRLHENVVWSQRDNFVGVPTDCPQRDERLGWTGDAQAFASTANTLVDAQSFWRSWLIDLDLEQDENGDVAAVVPNILKDPPSSDWIMMGRAGWADAATIVPYSIYESYGSQQILRQQLQSMRRWTWALDGRRGENKFLPTQFQFGDWCDPDAPGDQPWLSKVSADFVANCFFAHTAELTSKVESLVGSEDGAEVFAQMAKRLKSDIWEQMGEEALSTSAGCSITLEFAICPESERAHVAKVLSEMVRKDRGKITTGFLGTPLILHALSKNGHPEEAYLMLMRREILSWLYQVDSGATTIWERWDAIRADGSINSGEMATENASGESPSMISFNHYAYGAVVDWMYRNVAGLAPTDIDPGYRTTIVAPKPAEGISFASAEVETPFGRLAISWRINKTGDLAVNLEVPFGATAKLELPVTNSSQIHLNGKKLSNGESISYGVYTILVSNPRIVEYT